MVERPAHNGYDVGSSPIRNNGLVMELVDISYLGFENCRFESCQGQQRVLAVWRVFLFSMLRCLWQMAERSIAMVLKTIGCEPQGFKSPFAQKQYLRDGMVDVMDSKSMAIACGFKSHRRYCDGI
jgi:hypothetical protein